MVTLLAQNSLLMGTTSHLSNAMLCHQLEAGLELHLSQKVESNTIIATLDADNFMDWNIEVKCINDALWAETVHLKEIATCNHERSQCDQQNQNPEPTTHKNLNNTTASNATLFSHLPKLTNNECTLLMDNHGCLKCHQVFTYHVSKDCPNNWPNAAMYCPITAAKKAGKVRKATTTAIMPGDASQSLTIPTVVASNPVTYIAMNMHSIIDDDDNYSDSDDSSKVSMHTPLLCTAVVSEMKIPASTAQHVKKKGVPVTFFKPTFGGTA